MNDKNYVSKISNAGIKTACNPGIMYNQVIAGPGSSGKEDCRK